MRGGVNWLVAASVGVGDAWRDAFSSVVQLRCAQLVAMLAALVVSLTAPASQQVTTVGCSDGGRLCELRSVLYDADRMGVDESELGDGERLAVLRPPWLPHVCAELGTSGSLGQRLSRCTGSACASRELCALPPAPWSVCKAQLRRAHATAIDSMIICTCQPHVGTAGQHGYSNEIR